MQFIQVAYCTTVPLLLIALFLVRERYRWVVLNVLAVSNFILIGYSLFLLRQLVGLYQLSRQFRLSADVETAAMDLPSVTVLLVVLLPLFFFSASLRRSRLLSVLLLVLLYWNNPVHSWNGYDLFTKIAVYFSLFCTGYGLLWLLMQLPHQSRK